jgi:hypothetical protein
MAEEIAQEVKDCDDARPSVHLQGILREGQPLIPRELPRTRCRAARFARQNSGARRRSGDERRTRPRGARARRAPSISFRSCMRSSAARRPFSKRRGRGRGRCT